MKSYNNFIQRISSQQLNEAFVDGVNTGINIPALKTIRMVKTFITINFSFFSSLLSKLKIKEVNDPRCDTMWTDGHSIGYNPDFVNSLEYGEVVFVIIHEIMHNAQLHFLRMKDRHPTIWNYAADYAINILIDDMVNNINDKDFKTPNDILLKEEYRNMSAEIIYDILFEEKIKEFKDKKDFMDGLKDGAQDRSYKKGYDDGKKRAEDDNQKDGGQKDGGQKDGGQKDGGQQDGGQKDGGQQDGGQKVPNYVGGSDNYNNGFEDGYKDGRQQDGGQQDGGRGYPDDWDDKSDDYKEGYEKGINGDFKSSDDAGGNGDGPEWGGLPIDPRDLGLDENIIGQDVKQEKSVNGENSFDYGDGDPNDRKSEKEIRDMWKDYVNKAKRNTKPGDMGAGLDRWIEIVGLPTVDWRQAVQKFVRSAMKKKRGLKNWNKRKIHQGIYTSGMKNIDGNGFDEVVVAIDTSGSITVETINLFATELNGLFKTYSIKTLHIIWCDADIPKTTEKNGVWVGGVQTFKTVDNKFDFKLLKSIGGGGTSFIPPFKWVKENLIDSGPKKPPAFFLYFTDTQSNLIPSRGEKVKFMDGSMKNLDISKYEKRILWMAIDVLPTSDSVLEIKKKLPESEFIFLDKYDI